MTPQLHELFGFRLLAFQASSVDAKIGFEPAALNSASRISAKVGAGEPTVMGEVASSRAPF